MMKNKINLEKGILENYTDIVIRKASDMQGFYQDEETLHEMIQNGNPVIYEVYAVVSEGEGELCYAVTVLHSGKVGNEYYMTKGHYHQKRDRAELYMGIRGHGILLMENEGEVQCKEMRRGDILYVPPYWAHRSINVGNNEFVFLSIYPGDAGHDYGTIVQNGFSKIVIAHGAEFSIEDNPKHS